MILDYVIMTGVKPFSLGKKYKLRGYYPSKSNAINVFMKEFKMSFKEAKEKVMSEDYKYLVFAQPLTTKL